MSIPAVNVNYIMQVFTERLGAPYVFGGVWSPTNPAQGCDCSGCVGTVLEALTNGPDGMNWDHDVSTESWPFNYGPNTPAAPGTIGPYGTIAIASPADAPSNAALIINIMHDGGGADSHMNCYLAGEYMESNGTDGTCTAPEAYPNTSSIWTDHWFLPGPIDGAVTPVTTPPVTLYGPDISNNNWTSTAEVAGWLDQCFHTEGFSWMEHKVSEGNYYTDPYWPAVLNWCEQNNIPCIGYHYVTTDDPASQAAKFLGNAGGANAMLDFEANSGDIDNFWNVVNAFNDAGVNIALSYIPNWYWQQIGSPDLSEVPGLISSAYYDEGDYAYNEYQDSGGDNGPGWTPYGGCMPVIWQFTAAAVIDGKSVDANAFKGTPDDLRALLGGAVAPPPAPPPPPPNGDISMADAQSIQAALDGIDPNTLKGLPWRANTLLATYKGAGVPDLPEPLSVPWSTTSLFDAVTVLSAILTQLTSDGKTAFDLLVEIHAAVVKPAS